MGGSGKGAPSARADTEHGALGSAPCRGVDARGRACDAFKGGSTGVKGLGTGGKGDDIPKTAWVRPPRVFTEDGYEVVQPQRVRVQVGEQGKGPERGTGEPNTGGHTERKRWSEDDSDDDLDMGDEDDGNDDEDGWG